MKIKTILIAAGIWILSLTASAQGYGGFNIGIFTPGFAGSFGATFPVGGRGYGPGYGYPVYGPVPGFAYAPVWNPYIGYYYQEIYVAPYHRPWGW